MLHQYHQQRYLPHGLHSSRPLRLDTFTILHPHRDFLMHMLDSMALLGRPVYVASFGLKEWVLPVAELVFGTRVPASNIFALDGHPPRFPVVLNKNLWLAEVMERHGARLVDNTCIMDWLVFVVVVVVAVGVCNRLYCFPTYVSSPRSPCKKTNTFIPIATGLAPRDVLLVDDQISNVARALAGGFSALQVPPSRGLDSTIWARALANATTDGHLLPPPPRTHAYCPAHGAVFADGDGSAYAQTAQDVVIQAPDVQPAATKHHAKQPLQQHVTLPTDTDEMAPLTPKRPPVHRHVCDKDVQKPEANKTHHHRFILRHGDFEAVRSMVTPAPPKPRHTRSRSQDALSCDDAAEKIGGAIAPSTPIARGSRQPLRRVRSFSAAGWWSSVGPLESTALCAQMARLGMTAEA